MTKQPQLNSINEEPTEQGERLVRDWFSNSVGAAPSPASGSPESDSLATTLAVFSQVIKESKWSIILLIVLATIGGVVKALSETPIYQASLTMAVEPSGSSSGTQALFDPYAYRFYETQYELLKSRSVAERVVDKLALAERDSVTSLLVPPSLTQTLIFEFEKLVGVKFSEPLEKLDSVSALSDSELQGRKRWLTSVVQSGVSVSGGEKTNLVNVTYRSINPEFAAEVANTLVEAYIDQGLDSQLNRSQQTTRWLSQRISELKKTLDQAQSNLQTFLVEEDMLDSSSGSDITASELRALNTEYIASRSRLDELEKRYGGLHPKIAETRAEVLAAKRRLDSKSRSISSNRQKQIELARLEREVDSNKELYEAFLNKFREADLSSSATQVARARIIDRAMPPGGPIYPQKQRIIMAWAMGGLFLGIGLAFFREQLDSTFKNGRVVENKLGLPLFGVMQSLDKNVDRVERHYLDNKRSVFSESVNHIRTGVMYSNVDHPPQVIVITSSVQSEGKTTLASNLALSYAQLGPTLLIDADLRRPRIKNIVDTGVTVGLVDLVAGVVDYKDCVKQDAEENDLYVLKAGTTPPNPLELLASDRFKVILQTLKKKFEHIIIDTAPVLPASDAVVLGQLCDCLMLAVQSDRTTHHMARDAIRRLTNSKVNVSGLILTQANIKKDNPYAYGGYYGYGAYAYVEENTKIK
ncbi:polysaccharide biosynthesis tyrosine autokinase [Arenicella sp. 4NH20-0111]|uniref:GumC family protein n=1 Tax=Arenicella sp. 4NH20-0111 TaxID=3127648 RepID=UPI0031099B70